MLVMLYRLSISHWEDDIEIAEIANHDDVAAVAMRDHDDIDDGVYGYDPPMSTSPQFEPPPLSSPLRKRILEGEPATETVPSKRTAVELEENVLDRSRRISGASGDSEDEEDELEEEEEYDEDDDDDDNNRALLFSFDGVADNRVLLATPRDLETVLSDVLIAEPPPPQHLHPQSPPLPDEVPYGEIPVVPLGPPVVQVPTPNVTIRITTSAQSHSPMDVADRLVSAIGGFF
jgi:hypothetical protein